MRDQLLGVLREIVAADRRRAGRPAVDAVGAFGSPAATGATTRLAELPPLRVDRGRSRRRPGWPASRSTTRCSGWPRSTTRRSTPSRSTWPGAGPRSRSADSISVTTAIDRMLGDDPWEWRAVWTAGSGRARPTRRPGARPRPSTPSSARCRGSWRRSSPWRLACELTAQTSVSQELYRTCARVDANYVAPAAFGLARHGADRARCASRPGRARPDRPDERGLRRPPGRPGPRSSSTRAWGCQAWRKRSVRSSGSRSIRASANGSTSVCSPRPSTPYAPVHAEPKVVICWRAGHRAGPARGRRRRLSPAGRPDARPR